DDMVMQELDEAQRAHPEAKVVIHPEARRDLLARADFVVSTSAMGEIAERYDSLIIGTERGLIDRLKERFPEKTIIPLSRAAVCGNMHVNPLAKRAWSLEPERHEVVLDEEIRGRAEHALRGMLAIAAGWRLPTEEEEAIEARSMAVAANGCG